MSYKDSYFGGNKTKIAQRIKVESLKRGHKNGIFFQSSTKLNECSLVN
jgi:hypothetical protein